jgi:hypothetical protein
MSLNSPSKFFISDGCISSSGSYSNNSNNILEIKDLKRKFVVIVIFWFEFSIMRIIGIKLVKGQHNNENSLSNRMLAKYYMFYMKRKESRNN